MIQCFEMDELPIESHLAMHIVYVSELGQQCVQQWHIACSVPQLIVVQWSHMATYNLITIDSGNGLLPDGAEPLSETMLTYC